MKHRTLGMTASLLVFTVSAAPAIAYVSPGAGFREIGSVLAFLAVIALIVAALIWYPAKLIIARIKGRSGADETDAGD